MKKILNDHLRQYWVIYLTLSCVFLAGIVFGSFGIGAIGANNANKLSQFTENLLKEQPDTIDQAFLAKMALENIIVMAGIWLLGLTIIGTPLIYLIVFTKGFVLGFTATFIVNIKGMLGIGLVFLTILLPSLLSIPSLLFGSGLATIFSFLLLYGKQSREGRRKDFFQYSLASMILTVLVAAAGVIQAYLTIVGTRFFGY